MNPQTNPYEIMVNFSFRYMILDLTLLDCLGL